MESYRSMALTSSIGIVLKKLDANRLSWWREEHSALKSWQAGFHKGCSTTDQFLRLSQFISDGFQSTQRRRNIANFFDFTRAYDHVWRTGLLMKMSKMGVPNRFTESFSSWFLNRTPRMQVNGTIGLSRTFKTVLTHGSVLFTTYINQSWPN